MNAVFFSIVNVLVVFVACEPTALDDRPDDRPDDRRVKFPPYVTKSGQNLTISLTGADSVYMRGWKTMGVVARVLGTAGKCCY